MRRFAGYVPAYVACSESGPPAGTGNQTAAQHIFTRNISAIAVAVRMRFAILLPEQLQREVFVSLKLGLQRAEI
jgi:hypothetical protein